MAKFHVPCLLACCSAVDQDGKLARVGESMPLYPWQRAAGFAAALTGGFTDKVVLFGPLQESAAYKELMLRQGANAAQIQQFESHETTISNGRSISRYLESEDVSDVAQVRLSTSSYHIDRALHFLEEDFGLLLHGKPAEAFFLANLPKCEVKEAQSLIRELSDPDWSWPDFDCVYDTQTVGNLKGIADHMADRYYTDKRV